MDCVAGLRIVDTVVTKISADEDGVVQGDRPPPANPAKDATILGKPAINIKSELSEQFSPKHLKLRKD